MVISSASSARRVSICSTSAMIVTPHSVNAINAISDGIIIPREGKESTAFASALSAGKVADCAGFAVLDRCQPTQSKHGKECRNAQLQIAD